MKEIKTGRIIKGIGGFYYVDTGSETITCRACGKLRKLGEVPYVGDVADIEIQSDNTGYLREIHERKNLMKRPAVANLDIIAILVSEAPPKTDLYFADKILAMAALKNIKACIVINKCDEDDGEKFFETYSKADIDVFRVSAKNGEGTKEFKEYIKGRFVALTGNSGVGKSTLINSLIPEASLQTGEINKKIGRGKHTTRTVELLKLGENTWLADTPGFSVFDITAQEQVSYDIVESLFKEISDVKDNCRFQGCSHIKEEECAVIKAVQEGKISKTRYESYTRLYSEIKEQTKYNQAKNKRG